MCNELIPRSKTATHAMLWSARRQSTKGREVMRSANRSHLILDSDVESTKTWFKLVHKDTYELINRRLPFRSVDVGMRKDQNQVPAG